MSSTSQQKHVVTGVPVVAHGRKWVHTIVLAVLAIAAVVMLVLSDKMARSLLVENDEQERKRLREVSDGLFYGGLVTVVCFLAYGAWRLGRQ